MSIAWPDRIATTQTDTIARPVISPSFRLDLAHSGTALLGAALVVASYLFDGHTVTAAPAPIVRLANVAHVTAAGVWLGGVLLMGSTLSSRHRRSTPLGAAAMAVRFSRVASVALAVVGVAGIALTWAILESPMQLLATPWGRFLLVKLALVGTAVGIGAFNHFKVVPFLGVDTGEDVAALRLRMLVRIEGAVLLVVVAVTAVFVGLAS
jgi:copper transport protein